jgi:hypothetical protein
MGLRAIASTALRKAKYPRKSGYACFLDQCKRKLKPRPAGCSRVPPAVDFESAGESLESPRARTNLINDLGWGRRVWNSQGTSRTLLQKVTRGWPPASRMRSSRSRRRGASKSVRLGARAEAKPGGLLPPLGRLPFVTERAREGGVRALHSVAVRSPGRGSQGSWTKPRRTLEDQSR